ncbi:MAG: hypothetical protein V9E94_14480 [Microthrixaceae bacterium]
MPVRPRRSRAPHDQHRSDRQQPIGSIGARSAGRSARRRLVGADRVAATASIRDRLLDLVELQGGTDERTASVALYTPVDGEVDVSAITPALRERGMDGVAPHRRFR